MPREPGERTRREQEALPITQSRSGWAERAEEQELMEQPGCFPSHPLGRQLVKGQGVSHPKRSEDRRDSKNGEFTWLSHGSVTAEIT